MSEMGRTSAGFPIIPAMPPARPAHAMVQGIDSLSWPLHCFARSATMLYKPKRAVEYVDCLRIEAESPPHSDVTPEDLGLACMVTP